MATHEQTLLKRQPVPNYDPSRYQVERLWAPAADGVKVPVALVHKKGLVKDGKSALYLYGYGSDRLAIPGTLSPGPLSLAGPGPPSAHPHIPGRRETGHNWPTPGPLMHK